MREEMEASFDVFAIAAMPRLRQLAYAWSRDWHRADDLVQETLERVYTAWPRVRRNGQAGESPFAYARTTMLRHLISEQRRPWRHRGSPGLHLHGPDGAGPGTAHTPSTNARADVQADASSLNLDLLSAIAALPARQCAVVLLRYVEDLTVTEVADALNISEGTVKSQAHHARTALQAHLGPGYLDGSHRDPPERRDQDVLRTSKASTRTGGPS